MPRLNGASSYTIQLWFYANEWTEGARLLSRGSDFAITIGDGKSVNLTVGDDTFRIGNSSLEAGAWHQLTIVNDEGTAYGVVNGTTVKIRNATVGAIPSSNEPFIIGGGFTGRIDEVRFWDFAMDDYLNYFAGTTLNQWNPYWDNLVAYYKFDQDLCDDIVDYKSVYDSARDYNNHGILSQEGASRVKVDDNTGLPYLLNGAYTANERFFDRGITREQYLLSNDLIILGIASYSNGHLKYVNPCCHADIVNGEWLASYEGREGVMSLNGDGYLNCGVECLIPTINENTNTASEGFTFETWIYLEEWTEGAFLFRKETEDGLNGFSIRLGKEENKQVIVRCNGNNFVNNGKMKVGQWTHVMITTRQSGSVAGTYQFCFDGSGYNASLDESDGKVDFTPIGMDDCIAYIGEGLKAKLDNTAVWNTKFSSGNAQAHMYNLPRVTLGCELTSSTMMAASALYTYDEATRPGWDYYSQDEWREVMMGAYEGYRGAKCRISVKSHTNWLTTISKKVCREHFVTDLVNLSEGYEGVELDLEWCESESQWKYYAALIKEIREALPEDKSFVVSCHCYSATYKVPVDYMQYCDGFTFQVYGEQSTWYNYGKYDECYNIFREWGFDPEKIYMSYSTTTSGVYNSSGSLVGAINGIRSGFFGDDYELTDANIESYTMGSATYYFCGPRQTYKRAKYVSDNNAMGIFYWDMGNDYVPSHDYCLAKWASYGLNANVDTLITEVDIRHFENVGINTVAAEKSAPSLILTPSNDYNTLSMVVSTGEAIRSASVTSPTGALMVSVANSQRMNLAGLAKGYYIVTVVTERGQRLSTKFVKR
ncbi:MAG: hypothetical protein LIO90_11705 [Bacteroidales bacterium]|nr:hypothetical protein [Bacteroidales bacterium]